MKVKILENSKAVRLDNKKDKDEKTLIDYEIYEGSVITVDLKDEQEIEEDQKHIEMEN
jgi:hypothetical protein